MKGRTPLRVALITVATMTALATSAHAAAAQPKVSGDPAHGRQVFVEQCSLCHTTTPSAAPGAGPMLKGIVGRKAGAGDPKFTYTAAMKKSGLTWSQATLLRLLTDPNKTVPGTAMPIALPGPKDRQDVIAYLATLK